MCICIRLSYQVCCFVTNFVKIIPSSECLFLCPFCIVSAWERNGKRANSHRVYMYTFVLSESKRRVKPSADVRVVIPYKKKTQRRLHRLHIQLPIEAKFMGFCPHIILLFSTQHLTLALQAMHHLCVLIGQIACQSTQIMRYNSQL